MREPIAVGDTVQRVGTTFTYDVEPIGVVVEVIPVERRWPDLRVATQHGVLLLKRWVKLSR
jgi:hypothetical protein